MKKTPFKRHFVKDLDPVQELVELYNENPELTTQNNHKNKETDIDSLKILIEENRFHRRRVTLAYLFIIFLFFVFSAVTGFFYFNNRQLFKSDSVSLEISAPDKIKIGETFTYNINYKNNGEYPIYDARILLQYPSGFIMSETSPEISNHKLVIGEIKPGQEGKMSLTGKIVDRLNNEQKITAGIFFVPSNFNSEFKQEKSFSITTEEPDLLLDLNLPANAILTNKFLIKTKLKNPGNTLYEKARIKIDYPEGFTFLNSKPSPIENNNEWEIEIIEPQQESPEIIIEGFFHDGQNFTDEESRTKNFNGTIRVPGKDNIYHPVKEIVSSVKIIEQPLWSYLIINGSSENKNFEIGKPLNLSLIIKNTGSESFFDAGIKLLVKTSSVDILDWEKIEDKNFGKISKNNEVKEIFWNQDKIKELKEIKPRQEVILDLVLPIKSKESLKEFSNLEIGQSFASFQNELIAKTTDNIEITPIKSTEISMKLISNLDLGVKALYYFTDGTPLGSGPLPFKVGEETSLRIFWDLNNDWHEVNNVVIKTTVPEYVEISEERSTTIGKITYDSTTREVLWLIDRLPEAINEAHANFKITIKPQLKDLGQIIKLTGNTTISAIDSATLDNIIRTKNITTSALEKDEHANTTGLVEK